MTERFRSHFPPTRHATFREVRVGAVRPLPLRERAAETAGRGCPPSPARGEGEVVAARRADPFRLALLLLTFSFPAVAAEPTPRERGDLAIRARHILKKYCHECHSGGEKSRGRFVALDHTKFTATGPHPVAFVAPNDPKASQILHFIEDGSMPPGSRRRPKPAEVDALRVWIAAGAPGFPAAFDDAATMRAIHADLARQNPDDAKHLRYVSFAHLVRDDAEPPDLATPVDELRRALAAVADPPPKDRELLAPVDEAATLYRLDVRTLGWDNRELFARLAGQAPQAVHPLTAYDLLLLEYPHAVAPDPQLADYVREARLVRPVPFLRGDWLSRVLAKDAPLGDDLRSLAALSRALRAQGDPALGAERDMPCGTRSRTFGGRDPGASLGAWYSGDITPAPPPFPLAAEIVDAEGKPLAAVTTGQPFRLRVQAKKNVRFVLLLVQADGLVRVQPTNQNGMLDADEVLLGPTLQAPFKIPGIPTGETKATEYFVLLAVEMSGDFPTPVVVRSRHKTDCDAQKRFPVYRFLFDDRKLPEGFDPARVVRRVVPVNVAAE